jgi:hypothetical protein
MLTRPGPYDRLRYLSTLDPAVDCNTIYRTTALDEFPFDTTMRLLLAFWRTFAIPHRPTAERHRGNHPAHRASHRRPPKRTPAGHQNQGRLGATEAAIRPPRC